VVHRDGEGAAGFEEVPTDVRDPTELTYEGGIIGSADVDNVLDLGEGGDPQVSKDDRENDI
jgi:hypothetical protein